MGYRLSNLMCAIGVPNTQTGSSQLFLFTSNGKTKPEVGVKNGCFLCIFELLYFYSGERPDATSYGSKGGAWALNIPNCKRSTALAFPGAEQQYVKLKIGQNRSQKTRLLNGELEAEE